MSDVLSNLDPEPVWRHFGAISAIPRCSRKEEAVRAYVLERAAALHLETGTDDAGNVVVRKPAAVGHERVPAIALQGHLDMVCEKNYGVEHDFGSQPLRLAVTEGWVHATDTTLGADNGIAVAMMLAVMEQPVAAGPIECLFTVDEESGLTGALRMDPSLLTARMLINIDSEDEGTITIGCAGGRNTHLSLPVLTEEGHGLDAAARITVTGLRGGHSGVNIGEERANGVKLGARVLDALVRGVPALRVAGVEGGDKHNAIPRECRIEVTYPSASETEVAAAVSRVLDEARAELGGREPGLTITREAIDVPRRTLTASAASSLAHLLLALPHGVLTMSHDVAGLVETSSNLAAVKTDNGTARILTSQRSSRPSLGVVAGRMVTAAGALAGATSSETDVYPAWPPRPESTLLARAKEVYAAISGAQPTVEVVHAGLECGVIGAKIPEMEMISIGPDIEGAHTPRERVHVASTARTWRYLVSLIESVAG